MNLQNSEFKIGFSNFLFLFLFIIIVIIIIIIIINYEGPVFI